MVIQWHQNNVMLHDTITLINPNISSISILSQYVDHTLTQQ